MVSAHQYGKSIREREYTEDSEDEIETARSIRAVGKSDKKIISSTDHSKQFQSMEAQIKILVDNMQVLQTKMDKLENTPRRQFQSKETRTCFNCDKPGQLAKDCRRLRRQKKDRNFNVNRSSQSET